MARLTRLFQMLRGRRPKRKGNAREGQMIIGVPIERQTIDKRMAITTDGAQALIKRGHTVLIEQDAGLGSHFTNDQYKEVGCTIVPTLKDIWTKSELVVKVKEPHQDEYQYFNE